MPPPLLNYSASDLGGEGGAAIGAVMHHYDIEPPIDSPFSRHGAPLPANSRPLCYDAGGAKPRGKRLKGGIDQITATNWSDPEAARLDGGVFKNSVGVHNRNTQENFIGKYI